MKSLDQLLWKRFQNAGKSSERISANAQLARTRNSYANFVQNQSKNREWIRTTKTAWSESTETATALLVPANMYIIQLHTWECVLLNKLVQTLCLWNNLCIGHYTKSIKKTSKIDSDFDMHGDGQILTRTGEGQILTCMASGRFGHALGGRADFDMHGDGRHHFHNHFVNPNRKKCMWNSFERGQQQLSQSGHMSYFSARTFWRVRSLNHAHASFSSSRCFRSQVRSYDCKIILKSCSHIFQLFQIF